MIPARSPWIQRPAPKPEAKARLICFPYAGAGASVFLPWIAQFRDFPLELCLVQLPGRESRIRETPLRSLPDLIAALMPAVEPLLDKPFSLFGHSMGTLVAFELMRELRRKNLPMPTRTFMSGALPPNLKIFRPVSHLPDDQIIQELFFRYKVLPTGFATSPDLLGLIMPTVRADLALMENHTFRPEAPFATPITAIGGVDDISTPSEGLAAWSDHTIRPLNTGLVPGGHFYIRPPPRELLQLIIDDLGLEPC